MKLHHQRDTFGYAKYGYLFSLPFVIAFIVFSLYPTIYSAVLGFTDSQGAFSTEWHFLTDDLFKNYAKILSNKTFITSIGNTFRIWIVCFIPQMGLALLLTAWFTSHRKMRFQGLFKVVFYMPNIITAATVAVMFNSFFGYPVGPINDTLRALGILKEPYYFINNPSATQNIVSFIQFWMWFGYTTIILISGVLGISPEIYEAAEIDGANSFQTFWQITVPNIKTIMLYTLITSLIGGLNMFDIPHLFNWGGPDNATTTTSVFIYKLAFTGKYQYARASAASMIMFVIIAVMSAIVFYLMRDKDEAAFHKAEKARMRAYKKSLREKKKLGGNV